MIEYHKAFLPYYDLDDFVDFIQAMDTVYLDHLHKKRVDMNTESKKKK